MSAALELEHHVSTFNPNPYFHHIDEILRMNKYAVPNSYIFAEKILPKFNSDLKELLDKYTKVPAHHMDNIINNLHMPIKYKCGDYGYSPRISSVFTKWSFVGTHIEILNKVPDLINQINKVYKTLHDHPFDYVKLTFYCGTCKKVHETFFDKMPHPSIHITCPVCLTEKLAPVHNNEEYYCTQKSNYRKHAYSENEYYPLQMEGVVLGTFNKHNHILKSYISQEVPC